MAWAHPEIIGQMPHESNKDYWERWRANENRFSEEFNKSWLNRLAGNQIPTVPSYDDLIAH